MQRKESREAKLERMLRGLVDAVVGSSWHDLGSGYGIADEESRELIEFLESDPGYHSRANAGIPHPPTKTDEIMDAVMRIKGFSANAVKRKIKEYRGQE